MHPKIKELALQAGGSHYPEVGGKTLEKFAELVVKETALIAGLMEQEGRKNIGANILDSFGIKE